jgi:hypothetical protein
MKGLDELYLDDIMILAYYTPPTPEPTYTVVPDVITVDEGAAVTFTVTTNIPDGTLYYTLEGTINSSDVVGGLLSGSVDISGGTGIFYRTFTTDGISEGSETVTAKLRLESIDGTIVAESVPVTINDTSIPSTNNPATVLRIATSKSRIQMGGIAVFILGSGDSYTLAIYDSWIASNDDRIFVIADTVHVGANLKLEFLGEFGEGWTDSINGTAIDSVIQLCGYVYTETYGQWSRVDAENNPVEQSYTYSSGFTYI